MLKTLILFVNRIRTLQIWHGKHAHHATYKKLLRACVECGEHEAAEMIIKLLGGNCLAQPITAWLW